MGYNAGVRVVGIFVFVAVVAVAAPLLTALAGEERDVGKAFCERANLGVTTATEEFSLPDRARVDCLVEYPLANFAVEIDRSSKWAECIGQALLYGEDSNSIAVCALFQDSHTSDKSFVRHAARADRVISALQKKDVAIRLFCITADGVINKCEL